MEFIQAEDYRKKLLFVETKCTICLSEYTRSNPPHMICNQQHAVCLNCYQKHSMSPQGLHCPKCGQIVIKDTPRKFRLHQQLLEWNKSRLPALSLGSINNNKELTKSPDVVQKYNEERRFKRFLSGRAGFEWFSHIIESGEHTDRPLVGLGNVEDITYYLEFFRPLDALKMLGYDLKQLSPYDALSFYMMYDQDKQSHKDWYIQRLQDQENELGIKWGMANMYYNRTLYIKASQYYLRCLQIEPNNQILIERMALTLDKLGQMQPRDYYLKKLAMKSRNSRLVRNFYIKDPEKIEEAQRYCGQCPQDGKRWIILANHYEQREQKIECLSRGLEKVDSPHYAYYVKSNYPSFQNGLMEPGVLMNLAQTTAYCCDKLRYTCALEASKHPVVLSLNRGQQYLQIALEAHPQIIYDMGISHFERKKYQSLLDLWSDNESLLQRFSQYHHFKGLANMELGKYEKAMQEFQQTQSFDPYVNCLYSFGQRKEALRMAKVWLAQSKSAMAQKWVVVLLKMIIDNDIFN